MKQIAQYQDGRLELQDVPMPVAPPGGILVRNTHSVISVGTERMKMEQARMNLLQKARARPDQVRRVLETARNLGWRAALDKVRNRLDTPTPLGYSAAGIVTAVDPGNTRFHAGDRVACGGAECAFHAEYIAIPDLLAAKIPDGVENWQAAYTTVASIALQTVRQLAPALSERVLVLGQGLIGLLVTAILRANGARVMAADLAKSKRSFAQAMGAEHVIITESQDLLAAIQDWTDGYGVDAVVIATASESNAPVEQALAALRDRGRMVVVGNSKVELPWKEAYGKEIDVRYSRSYGPGRYDPAYEYGGSDYPIGYVRWTEQRNFEACLHLMKSGALNLDALTTRRAPLATALEVYRDLLRDHGREVGVILEYGTEPAAAETRGPTPAAIRVPAADIAAQKISNPIARLDVIGAGNFARTMLLPHLQGKIEFGTVVNATALSAQHVKTKFGFATAGADYAALLAAVAPAPGASARGSAGGAPAALLIATRHHLHAPIVRAALAAQRHLFVEKPLCLTRDELVAIDAALTASSGSIQVGFNRRFAPASQELKALVRAAPGPKSVSFRVFAGALAPGHWYANYAESGGRVLGEACHFLDFFCFLFPSEPRRVYAQTTQPAAGRRPFPDSVTAQVEFADGSSGQLLYSAPGDAAWPKETCTVFGAGFAAEVTNFQRLCVTQSHRKSTRTFAGKGHAEQMEAWLKFLRGEAEHPLPYAEARRSMLLTFAVLDSIQQGRAVDVGG